MRPRIEFLNRQLIEQIISEARDILCNLGITVLDDHTLDVLADEGARVENSTKNVQFTPHIIDKALETVPASFTLFDVSENPTHDFSGYNVYFTPGSSSLTILDHESQAAREPVSSDYIRYVKTVSQLEHLASQSTAFIPSDVDEAVSDSYRLYLSLRYGTKPVVTGTFSRNGFKTMKEMMVTVRGSETALKEKPLAIFSCCPTTPLKWAERSCHDIVNCGASGIPVELISMPLTGFTGPITLVGSLVGHTAENLAGIVISQLNNPGAPLLYGGAPAAFDMRHGTTPLGAIETQMMDCAYNEIGKYLGIPTQAYIGLSDAKLLDAQAGLETSMGATLAMLTGINNISGPGMLDFVNCFSLEKLVVDNEICGMTYRMARGIEPKDDIPTLPLYRELMKEQNLLMSPHTMKYLRKEQYLASKVIDRNNHARWQEKGSTTLGQRAHDEVNRLLTQYKPSPLTGDVQDCLTEIIETEAKNCGMDQLPRLEYE